MTDTVRSVVRTEIDPAIAAYEASGEFPYPIIRKIGEAGLFGATFPESLGGTDAGFLAATAISEEISRLAPEFGYAMNQTLTPQPGETRPPTGGMDPRGQRLVQALYGALG